jgi:steroid delta-isomerase-like uncharacterized protein
MAESERIVGMIGELTNRHDAEAIQGHLAEDMEFYNPITGMSGKQGMYEIHSTLFKAFPDIHYGVNRMISSGDTVVLECTLTGTHQNDLMGIAPTERRIELPAAFVIDTTGEKVRKWTSYFDVTTLMRQLGVQE